MENHGKLWFYWLVNLNSVVVFVGIAYIQQSVAKNLGFLIPFTSVLLALITIHMARNKLIYQPKKVGSLLATFGVFLNSLKMCCVRYRHLSGEVSSWLDRAKEHNGGGYSEAHVENVKTLVKLFPFFALQLLYRASVTQIPSGYYIQTMNSNLNLNGFLLPIAAMNVISILPLLVLAPFLECVSTCFFSFRRASLSPTALIIAGHLCAAFSAVVAGISELQRKRYPTVEQALSGKVLHVSSMPCLQLAPQYILLGMAEALVTPACSLVTFCLAPSSIRGISMHFLALSYGGGCFLGAFIIQVVYLVSGGSAHRYHPCADLGGAKMNTRCPPKRGLSAARFFRLCRLTVQPPQSYSVGGQRSSGQLTGKSAGALPDYRGRWCAVSRGHPG
ncbi:UNVERIFIED_CONTAM: hypothetical protein FKN15_058002 [Acipenser sinensis]